MALLTYTDNIVKKGVTNVYLEGKKIGEVHIVQGGFQYWPQGKKKHAGPVHADRMTLIAEIEGDD